MYDLEFEFHYLCIDRLLHPLHFLHRCIPVGTKDLTGQLSPRSRRYFIVVGRLTHVSISGVVSTGFNVPELGIDITVQQHFRSYHNCIETFQSHTAC